jgi:hypothetical protein
MMADTWRVHTNTGVANVPFDMALLYADARQRVLASRRLAPHYDLLLGDGYASDEDHLRWVVSARVGEIEAWAQQIKEDSDG